MVSENSVETSRLEFTRSAGSFRRFYRLNFPRTVVKTLSNKLNLEYPSPVYERIIWEIGRLCRQVMTRRF